MKIALLTSGILPIPAVQGGAVENLVDFYLEYNDRHRLHDITVYSVDHEAARRHPAQLSTVNHYEYIDVDSPWARVRRKLYQLTHRHEYHNHYIEFYFEQAYKRLARQQFDLILMENRPGYAYKLHNRGHQNLVLHLHNDLLNASTPHHQEIFDSFAKILTVSRYIKGRVATIAPSDKVQPVYNGIDLRRFSVGTDKAAIRQQLGLAESDFVLVFSGRVNKDKGIAELIDAMLQLQDRPALKLLVVGNPFFGNTGNEDSFVRSLKVKAEAIKDRIIFTGFIPYDQMPAYLNVADAAVIPSIWDDPFPTTVLEAQAMSLPVIVSNRGGIPEEVGAKNAIVVPTDPSFVEQLKDAIVSLYEQPEKRAQMAAASLERSKLFDKERFARDFFQALE